MSDGVEATLIIFCTTIVAVLLLAFQHGCIEWNVNNDAFYLEKIRIEEGFYTNE